jgi:hypothetical protein
MQILELSVLKIDVSGAPFSWLQNNQGRSTLNIWQQTSRLTVLITLELRGQDRA